jgi:hypothetical protein
MTTTLIHISSVAAQFIRVGEIIERHHGHTYRVIGRPLPEATAPGRVSLVAYDLEDEAQTFVLITITRDVMVKTYDEI